jgi:hypothetical protein
MEMTARELLRELAPLMKALSEIQFAKAGLTDIPVPSISTALDFMAVNIAHAAVYMV